MGNSMNRVQLMGHLGADPELKFGDSENPCLKLSLATNEVWRDKNEQTQKRTEWHRIEVWGSRARPLAELIGKGSRVYVDGSIRSRTVDGEGGVKQKYVDIRARDVIVIDYKNDARPGFGDGLCGRPLGEFDLGAAPAAE